MLRDIARAVVLKYPEPWLDRYGDEVLDLLSHSPVRVSDVGELFRGLVVERTRAFIEDADHPNRAILLLSLLPFTCSAIFVVSAWVTGFALRSWRAFPEPAEDFGTLVFVAGLVLFGLVMWQLRRQQKLTVLLPPGPRIPARLGVGLLTALFAVVAVVEWCGGAFPHSSQSNGGVDPFELMWTITRFHLYSNAASTLAASFWPQHSMLEAFGRLTTAEAHLRAAQTWADGCKTWMATSAHARTDDTATQLQEAESRIERWGAERAAALDQLQRLGYRSRFERPA
jgi:hypothetical protein